MWTLLRVHFSSQGSRPSQTFILCITRVQPHHKGWDWISMSVERRKCVLPPARAALLWSVASETTSASEDVGMRTVAATVVADSDRVCSHLSPDPSLIHRHTRWRPLGSPSDAQSLKLGTSAPEILSCWCRAVRMFSLHKWPTSENVPLSPASVFYPFEMSLMFASSTKDLSLHFTFAIAHINLKSMRNDRY